MLEYILNFHINILPVARGARFELAELLHSSGFKSDALNQTLPTPQNYEEKVLFNFFLHIILYNKFYKKSIKI